MKSEEHHSRQSVSETAEEHFLRGVYYYDKGLDARNAQDADSKKFFIQAFECFTQAAEMGNLHAQNQLGICYEFGLGIGQDCEKAIGWYTRAAEKGCSKAQNNLGCCYGSGEGVEADMREAFEWCRKAAKQGNPKAQYNLGVCYDEGIGIQRDAEQAVLWFKKRRSTDLSGPRKRRGSSSSWAVACKKTRIRPLNGSSRLPSRAMPRRRKIRGDCYRRGLGTEQNYRKAFHWYSKSASQGHIDAQIELGDRFFYGQGVLQDYEQAFFWYMKAAEQGNMHAESRVGYCFKEGFGVQQDEEAAMKWYLKAAKQGEEDSLLAVELHCQLQKKRSI